MTDANEEAAKEFGPVPGTPDEWLDRRLRFARQRDEDQAAGEEAGAELLKMPEIAVKAAIYHVAVENPRLYLDAQHGPSRSVVEIEVMKEVQRLEIREQARREYDQLHRPSVDPPEVVNLTDLLDEPDQPVRYRVDGLWPAGGRIVLAAQNKSGKTTLTGNLTRSLADGDDFLGKFDTESVSRIVLLDNEMSKDQTRLWLREQGVRTTDSVAVVNLRGRMSSFNILDPDVRREWAERIGPADVLIFDCLRPALDALGLSEQTEAGRFLEALDELMFACGIPELVVVHHMGHANERSRGDSRLEDWPDAKWKLVKDDADDPTSARYFSAFGRDVDQGEVRLHFDDTNRHLTVDGGSRKQATASRIEDTVTLYIAGNPGCGSNEIRENVAGDDSEKRRIVKSLIANGDVVMIQSGQKRQHYLSGDEPNVENGLLG